MDRQGCNCNKVKNEMTCKGCDNEMPLSFWCETCQLLVPEKRCPSCGLKAKKVRRPDHT